MSEGPCLTITEAARAAGKHPNSIRRRLDAGQFPGAAKNAAGEVEIPIDDLLSAGLVLKRPAPREPAEVDRLRDQLRKAERRAELAEALASERERALDDLRMALRALGSGEPHSHPRACSTAGASPALALEPRNRRAVVR